MRETRRISEDSVTSENLGFSEDVNALTSNSLLGSQKKGEIKATSSNVWNNKFQSSEEVGKSQASKLYGMGEDMGKMQPSKYFGEDISKMQPSKFFGIGEDISKIQPSKFQSMGEDVVNPRELKKIDFDLSDIPVGIFRLVELEYDPKKPGKTPVKNRGFQGPHYGRTHDLSEQTVIDFHKVETIIQILNSDEAEVIERALIAITKFVDVNSPERVVECFEFNDVLARLWAILSYKQPILASRTIFLIMLLSVRPRTRSMLRSPDWCKGQLFNQLSYFVTLARADPGLGEHSAMCLVNLSQDFRGIARMMPHIYSILLSLVTVLENHLKFTPGVVLLSLRTLTNLARDGSIRETVANSETVNGSTCKVLLQLVQAGVPMMIRNASLRCIENLAISAVLRKRFILNRGVPIVVSAITYKPGDGEDDELTTDTESALDRRHGSPTKGERILNNLSEIQALALHCLIALCASPEARRILSIRQTLEILIELTLVNAERYLVSIGKSMDNDLDPEVESKNEQPSQTQPTPQSATTANPNTPPGQKGRISRRKTSPPRAKPPVATIRSNVEEVLDRAMHLLSIIGAHTPKAAKQLLEYQVNIVASHILDRKATGPNLHGAAAAVFATLAKTPLGLLQIKDHCPSIFHTLIRQLNRSHQALRLSAIAALQEVTDVKNFDNSTLFNNFITQSNPKGFTDDLKIIVLSLNPPSFVARTPADKYSDNTITPNGAQLFRAGVCNVVTNLSTNAFVRESLLKMGVLESLAGCLDAFRISPYFLPSGLQAKDGEEDPFQIENEDAGMGFDIRALLWANKAKNQICKFTQKFPRDTFSNSRKPKKGSGKTEEKTAGQVGIQPTSNASEAVDSGEMVDDEDEVPGLAPDIDPVVVVPAIYAAASFLKEEAGREAIITDFTKKAVQPEEPSKAAINKLKEKILRPKNPTGGNNKGNNVNVEPSFGFNTSGEEAETPSILSRVIELLGHPDRLVSSTAAVYVTEASEDLRLNNFMVKLGSLKRLTDLENDPSNAKNPLFTRALNAVYRHNLALKWQHIGFLERTDRIASSFFAANTAMTRRKNNGSPLRRVFVAEELMQKTHDNMCVLTVAWPTFDDDGSVVVPKDRRRVRYGKRTNTSLGLSQSLTDESMSNSKSDLNWDNTQDFSSFGLTNFDMPLDLELERHFQNIFGVIRTCPSEIDRIQTLAIFVANVMGGLAVSQGKHNWELQLSAIKAQQTHNMVPIGAITHGNMLQRAVLYKALADRLGSVSCTLVQTQENSDAPVSGNLGKSFRNYAYNTVTVLTPQPVKYQQPNEGIVDVRESLVIPERQCHNAVNGLCSATGEDPLSFMPNTAAVAAGRSISEGEGVNGETAPSTTTASSESVRQSMAAIHDESLLDISTRTAGKRSNMVTMDFVVDLLHSPGRLIGIGTPEFRDYIVSGP